MTVEGLFLKNKFLTKEELKQAAEELGIDFDEVRLMYDRFKSMTHPHYKVIKNFQTAFKALISKKQDRVQEEEKPDQKSNTLGQIKALLEMPEEARDAALDGMDKETKLTLLNAMKKMLGSVETSHKSQGTWFDNLVYGYQDYQARQPVYQEILQNLKEINQTLKANPFDILALATRGQTVDIPMQIATKEAKPKKVISAYDLFTSRRLNKDTGLEITTKEQEQLAENTEIAYSHFTSKHLNEPVEDKRPKTGNPTYDAFTSKKLNP